MIGGIFIKRILWVSRHSMTSEQTADLERIYGDFELIQHDETLTDIDPLLGYDVDVYAVVLPVELIALLRKNTSADIIQPVSGRVKTDRLIVNNATGIFENEYAYKHLYWQLIRKCEIETERL